MRLILALTVLAAVCGSYSTSFAQEAGVITGRGLQKAAEPTGNPGDWISSEDFPSSALRSGKEGIVGFRLSITDQGNVENCEITKSSSIRALDDTTCRLLMERAKFKPARDSDGQPMEGSFSSRVVWTIPNTISQPQPGEVIITATVRFTGEVTDCTERVSGDAEPSGFCNRIHWIRPYVDGSGRPFDRRIELRTSVSVK